VTRHSLTLVYRGAGHVHPWLPACDCGWQGVPARRRFAEGQYRQHRGGGRIVRGGPGPRPLTPTADLPEELR
jgi:hypothetical protein